MKLYTGILNLNVRLYISRAFPVLGLCFEGGPAKPLLEPGREGNKRKKKGQKEAQKDEQTENVAT